jgi:hypothetical protein
VKSELLVPCVELDNDDSTRAVCGATVVWVVEGPSAGFFAVHSVQVLGPILP